MTTETAGLRVPGYPSYRRVATRSAVDGAPAAPGVARSEQRLRSAGIDAEAISAAALRLVAD